MWKITNIKTRVPPAIQSTSCSQQPANASVAGDTSAFCRLSGGVSSPFISVLYSQRESKKTFNTIQQRYCMGGFGLKKKEWICSLSPSTVVLKRRVGNPLSFSYNVVITMFCSICLAISFHLRSTKLVLNRNLRVIFNNTVKPR